MARQPRWLEYLSIDELHPNPDNPKAHDVDGLRTSAGEFGWVENVTLDERTGMLVSGHGRLDMAIAARANGDAAPEGVVVLKDGTWKLPVTRGWSSTDDEQARAVLVVLNESTIAGGWDTPKLGDVLESLSKTRPELVAAAGYTPAKLDHLLASLKPPPPVEEPPARPKVPSKPKTKPGDLWQLGDHRLLCGDARNPDDVATVLDGALVNVAFTSPPYAQQRDYDKASGFLPVPPDEYVDWFEPVAAGVAAHLAAGGSWFVNIKPNAEGLDTELYVFDLVVAHVRRWGWHFATEFCWERNGVPGNPHRRFKNQFEPVYQFARDEWKFRRDAVRIPSDKVPVYDPNDNIVHERMQGGPGFDFKRRRPNHSTESMTGMQGSGADVGSYVVDGLAFPGNRLPTFAGSHEATGHAAAFPVGLPAWFVKAYSDPGDVVFDPFLGSGSTLLAAHQLDRQGFGLELSPAYCDVICARFQRHTGIKPVRGGRPVNFT